MNSLSDMIVAEATAKLHKATSLTNDEREALTAEIAWIKRVQPKDPIHAGNLFLFNRLWSAK